MTKAQALLMAKAVVRWGIGYPMALLVALLLLPTVAVLTWTGDLLPKE